MTAMPGAVHRFQWRRVLSPLERLSEILFGLIMALSVTCSIGIAGDGEHQMRELLVGAIGCNTAWGLVDAVMYLLSLVVERSRSAALLEALRTERNADKARSHIAARLPAFFIATLKEPEFELEQLRQRLVVTSEAPPKGLNLDDWVGALAIFLLVFLSTLPVVIPFLLPVAPRTALRVSNGIAIFMLYAVGYRTGHYVNNQPALLGLCMVAIGLALLGITLALGG